MTVRTTMKHRLRTRLMALAAACAMVLTIGPISPAKAANESPMTLTSGGAAGGDGGSGGKGALDYHYEVFSYTVFFLVSTTGYITAGGGGGEPVVAVGSIAGGAVAPVSSHDTDTELSTTVPDTHTVTVTAEGGQVSIDGTVRDGEVAVARHSRQEYRMVAAEGHALDTLMYNGENVTDKVSADGVFTAPELIDDATLHAVFRRVPGSISETGASILLLCCALVLLVGFGVAAFAARRR